MQRRFLPADVEACSLLTIPLFLFATLGLACSAPDSEAPTADPDPVVNQAMNVSFASLPAGFAVAENSDTALRLEPSSSDDVATGERSMWLDVGDRSDFGIPLVEIVNSQKEQYEALEDGTFSGNRELGTHVGKAYYSRGGYTFDGAAVEETRIFLVHPTENRLVTFHYRYPADDDSGARIQELFAWLGELEAADPQADAAPTETTENK